MNFLKTKHFSGGVINIITAQKGYEQTIGHFIEPDHRMAAVHLRMKNSNTAELKKVIDAIEPNIPVIANT